MNEKRNRKTHIINEWLMGWRHQRNLGFSTMGNFYSTRLLESDGLHLSNKGERILAHEFGGLIKRALN